MTRFHDLRIPVVVALALMAGCSKHRPSYNVSGAVTYRGKPVEAGTLTFLPDSTQGNLGPLVSAVVKNGRYELRQDPKQPGTFGGAYIAVVHGYDGKPGGETAYGNPIFPEYKVAVMLPTQDAVQDFTVPVR